MTKRLIALALVSALYGCSSSNDDGGAPPADDATQTPDTGAGGGAPAGTPAGPAPPAGGGTPTADSKAGVWFGNMGFGDGVYVVGNDNTIAGLALVPDGSANSTFGSLGDADTFSGALDNYTHAASDPVSPGVFAQRGALVPPISYALNIVNGQTIESTDAGNVALRFAVPGELTQATPEAVAGDWSAVHSFCDATNCFNVVMNVSFNGTQITGNTDVINLATDQSTGFAPPIAGSVAQFGDVLNSSFTWNDLTFKGVVYFADDGRLVFNADDTSGADDRQTLTSVLTRQ